MRAAEGGKQVVVVVELKARFDEAANIAWARRLEASGVHVVYGLVGLKTHAKLTLVVRREGDGIRRYAHLGTGNYNPSTARIYTDLGLLTARETLTADVARVFDFLTSLSKPAKMEKMLVAPFDMLPRIVGLIRREAEHAKAGKPARIVAKMNALADESVIEALYEASCAGVQIDLIVRGICVLPPRRPRRLRAHPRLSRSSAASSSTAASTRSRTAARPRSSSAAPTGCRATCATASRSSSRSRTPRSSDRLRNEILATYLADRVKARRMLPDGGHERLAAARGRAGRLRAGRARRAGCEVGRPQRLLRGAHRARAAARRRPRPSAPPTAREEGARRRDAAGVLSARPQPPKSLASAFARSLPRSPIFTTRPSRPTSTVCGMPETPYACWTGLRPLGS